MTACKLHWHRCEAGRRAGTVSCSMHMPHLVVMQIQHGDHALRPQHLSQRPHPPVRNLQAQVPTL